MKNEKMQVGGGGKRTYPPRNWIWCDVCDGTGWLECGGCYGDGCFSCNGEGGRDCNNCNGNGGWWSY